MGLLYEDELLDTFGTWALAYIPYGGPTSARLRRSRKP